MLAPNPQANPLISGELPALPQQLHDVTVVRSKKYAQAKVVPVPPEEFGIAPNARSLREADYAFHEVISTHSKLVGEGYDEEVVKKIPSYVGLTNTEETERNTVDEAGQGATSDINKATRRVKVTEHYCRMDYEGTGKPCLYKVTTGGQGGNEILLTKDGKVDIEPVDFIPIVSMTPVIQTHRFFGRSVADLVMDIQRIKTALLRGVLDNSYMVNNPRTEVSESHASENTLDDLLVARPNGIVRTKQPGGLIPLSTLPIADKIFPVIEYMDATREWRTGVTRQGQGIDANALQNQSATAVNQAFTAAQARMKLIARIFAETGIRDLFAQLHATIRKHGQQHETVQLRNKWVDVDPREWKKREDLTIEVGLGNGGMAEQVAHIGLLGNFQKELVLGGKTNIVDDAKIYNTGKELAKALKFKNPDLFFNDPEAKDEETGQPKYPPPPPQEDPKVTSIKLQAQLDERADQRKAEIEKVQAQADIATKQQSLQGEMIQREREFELKKELALMQAALDADKFQHEEERKEREFQQKLAHNEQMHANSMQQAEFGLIAGAQSHEQKMEQANNKPAPKGSE